MDGDPRGGGLLGKIAGPLVPTAMPLPTGGKVRPPDHGSYLGAYYPPAPFRTSNVNRFRRLAGRDTSIVMWYQPWAAGNRSKFDGGATISVLRRRRIPMITWEPWNPGPDANMLQNPADQPRFTLSRILRGDYDKYIRAWARDIKAVGAPIMLRPMHEMNGGWYPWGGLVNGNSPGEFRATWRRIHRLFRQENALNVTWVWSINHESVPDTPRNSYAAYYPGDKYVDWTAISGFNWGTSGPYSHWRSFDHWYRRPLAFLKRLGKPIVIAEFASVEQGGSKADWLRDAYARIRTQHPEVKAIVYYNAREAGVEGVQDWRIDTSPSSLRAFRQSVASPYFTDETPTALQEWTRSLNWYDWVYLDSVKRAY